jgi:hypothetical protein
MTLESLRPLLASLVAVACSACVLDEKLGDVPTDEETSTTTGQETGTSTTASASPTAGQDSTDSSEPDGSDPGEPGTLCEQLCQGECLDAGTPDECLYWCEWELERLSDSTMCRALYVDALSCMIANECVEGKCLPPLMAFEESCYCEEAGGGGGDVEDTDGEVCFLEWACYGSDKRIECENDQCTCYDSGEVTGTCAAEGACSMLFGSMTASSAVFAEECCGFDDYPDPGV